MNRYARMLRDSVTSIVYSSVWDAEMIEGCNCDPGWEGHDCSLRMCPKGDDPLTTGQVAEVQYVLCVADGGWTTLQFDDGVMKRPSDRIAFDATELEIKEALDPAVGDVDVVFEDSETQFCSAAGVVTRLTFAETMGDIPALSTYEGYQTSLTLTASTATVVIRDSTGGEANVLSHGGNDYTAVAGTKEWLYCSGRGLCNQADGLCTCFPGYESSNGFAEEGLRGDCGYPDTPITECPGTTSCSGHGLCSGSPDYQCTCDEGWQGGDCSERVCPCGKAWFDRPTADNTAHDDAECSNRGICDRTTGECECADGFTGTACERFTCPGGDDCNGHGRCMSMSQLAELANVNGDDAGFTYGLTPHDPFTWDYNKVYGCKCDEGWHGYDCSRRTCPTGDDPKTEGVPEVQVIVCTATSGSFRLNFRQGVTDEINYDDDAATVEAALEALDSIAAATVEYTSGTELCDELGNNPVSITFDQDFGDLPAMFVEPGSDTLGPNGADTDLTFYTDGAEISGVASAQGTKEDATCSNRGICDESTGTCTCFSQYGSSDGYNNEGTRGDCGYLEPYMSRTQEEMFAALEDAREANRPSTPVEINF